MPPWKVQLKNTRYYRIHAVGQARRITGQPVASGTLAAAIVTASPWHLGDYQLKFRYSKFNGFDVFSINLGELMDSMSDALLDSGYDDDYYWTRQRKANDTSLDALRRALLQALMDQGLVNEQQIREMLAQNEGKFQRVAARGIVESTDRAAWLKKVI